MPGVLKICPLCKFSQPIGMKNCRNPKGCTHAWPRKLKNASRSTPVTPVTPGTAMEENGIKLCPKCTYKNHTRSMKCQNPTGCNQRWDYFNRTDTVSEEVYQQQKHLHSPNVESATPTPTLTPAPSPSAAPSKSWPYKEGKHPNVRGTQESLPSKAAPVADMEPRTYGGHRDDMATSGPTPPVPMQVGTIIVDLPALDELFACGFTTEDGAFLFWPQSGHKIMLNKEQTDLLYHLFMGTERATRNIS